MADKEKETNMSRRRFVKNTGYVAGGILGGGLLGSLVGINWNETDSSTPTKEKKDFNRALMYFTRQSDFEILGAATERIFPEDDNGPGAIELGVPYFIDHQLAGSFGRNDRVYMQGPFHEGTEFQGSQTPLLRHEIFMKGIRALDEESNKEYDSHFVDLEGEQQDTILVSFENDDVSLKGVKSSEFFHLLIGSTLAGAYSDPLYGGNTNMEGWKMKEHPGNKMSYLNDIEKDEFIEMEQSSLTDHQ